MYLMKKLLLLYIRETLYISNITLSISVDGATTVWPDFPLLLINT